MKKIIKENKKQPCEQEYIFRNLCRICENGFCKKNYVPKVNILFKEKCAFKKTSHTCMNTFLYPWDKHTILERS